VLLIEGEGKGTVQVTETRNHSHGGLSGEDLGCPPLTVNSFTVAYDTSVSRRVVVCDTRLDTSSSIDLVVSSLTDPKNSVLVWTNGETSK
jgi:hypothetical protein